jgi:hypothetical protein
MQDNEAKEKSTDEVESTRELKTVQGEGRLFSSARQ